MTGRKNIGFQVQDLLLSSVTLVNLTHSFCWKSLSPGIFIYKTCAPCMFHYYEGRIRWQEKWGISSNSIIKEHESILLKYINQRKKLNINNIWLYKKKKLITSGYSFTFFSHLRWSVFFTCHKGLTISKDLSSIIWIRLVPKSLKYITY